MWFLRSWADIRSFDIQSFLNQGYFIPKPKWSVDDIPDLTGKVTIVTGANSGIGKETAKALLNHNAKVYLACRNKTKAERAIEDLEKITGKKAIFLQLDLSNLKSVKGAVQEFTSKEKELHILFNNAGVMFPPHSEVAEGYDLQFHTNVTGHFYFTKLLLPTLLETTKHAPPRSVRVINTSSVGHYAAKREGLDFGSFKDGPVRNKYSVQGLYIQSKFGNIVYSNELHRRYNDQGLVSISVNPGNVNTDLYRYVFSDNFIGNIGRKISGLVPSSLGALTQLYAGTAPEAGEHSGEFYVPWARLAEPRPETKDEQLGKSLWTWLEEQVAAI